MNTFRQESMSVMASPSKLWTGWLPRNNASLGEDVMLLKEQY